jgi:signal transduction histidine kinase
MPQIERSAGTGIELQIEVAPGLWPVSIDPARLQAALLNIVINAREAMPSGGRLRIEAANIGSTADVSGMKVMVVVSDSGTGMNPEVAERAFDPFYTTRELGRGLGLSMAYGFVKQSGGRMEIDSIVGKGTSVRFYLPRAGERPMFGARLLH